MKRLRYLAPLAAVALAAAVLTGSGCAGRPSAEITDIDLEEIGLDSARFFIRMKVDNPSSLDLPLVNVSYSLSSRDKVFLAGEESMRALVPAGGSADIRLPVKVSFPETLATLEDARPGSLVPYTAKLKLAVSDLGYERLQIPIEARDSLPIPVPPKVAIESIDWQELKLSKVTGAVRLKVSNIAEYPIQLGQLNYELVLRGTGVGELGLYEKAELPPGATKVVTMPITFSPRRLGTTILDVVRGKGAKYAVRGQADLETPYGLMSVPIRAVGETTFARKDAPGE
jgi:LEA14-like dessication related protein